MNENRTSGAGIAQLDLFSGWPGAGGGVAHDVLLHEPCHVGARQTPPAGPGGGGGYQKIRGSQNFEFADPRLAELREIGLPKVWLAVAERVGFDAWMDVWRLLDAEEQLQEGEGTLRMRLRRYGAYLRYQRNRYIQALALQGVPAAQVRRMLAKNLGEHLTESHVERLMRKALRCRDEREKTNSAGSDEPGEGADGADLCAGVIGSAG